VAGRQITKELALKIVSKLKAVYDPDASGKHDSYIVYDGQGVRVGSFGIRRASEKDKGHDHIPKELHVGPGFAKLLGQCPKSRNDYLREIEASPDDTA
jgi:hypothetical protein